MRKQAKDYLTDLYYNPNSSYYDQGNRIANYNRRVLPLLKEDGLVYHSWEKIHKLGARPIVLWSLTLAWKSLVEKLPSEAPVSYWSRLKRLLNR